MLFAFDPRWAQIGSMEGTRAMPQFDAIVIGTGQAGPSLARRLVLAGRQVARIESDHVLHCCNAYQRHGLFVSRREVQAGEELLSAPQFFITVAVPPTVKPMPG